MARTVKFRAKLTIEADMEFDYDSYDESPSIEHIIKIETEEIEYYEGDYFLMENASDRKLTVELQDVRIIDQSASGLFEKQSINLFTLL